MENSLWSFGCSFTAEYHPIDNEIPNNYDKYKEWRGGNLPEIWPTILSKKLNLENNNKGRGATSNYDIFYSFCDSVSDLKKNDIVIIQWTSIYRFLLANPTQDNLMTILPSETYEEFNQTFIDNILVNRSNVTWLVELIYFSKIINEICKEKGVHLFYWTYDDDIISYIMEKWSKLLYDKFISIYGVDDILKKYHLMGHLDKLCNNKHTIDGETNGMIHDAHLGEFGHKEQAELFYNYIKERI